MNKEIEEKKIEMTTEEFLSAFADKDSSVNIRLFNDKDKTLPARKLACKVSEFKDIENECADMNNKGYGVFFVVNEGGDKDGDIKKLRAQFFECDDGSFEEQFEKISKFPLAPSFIVKTKKSLHTYFLLKGDGDKELFTPIQKALAEYMDGDPAVSNLSRVMRLPGFNHCKREPVNVEVICANPERKYTQEEIISVLPNFQDVLKRQEMTKSIAEDEVREYLKSEGIKKVCSCCEFIKKCKDNPNVVTEPQWLAMISNLIPFKNGVETIHKLSSGYHDYSKEETDNKIQHAVKSNFAPFTCKTIKENGFKCSKNCDVKSPAGLANKKLDLIMIKQMLMDEEISSDPDKNLTVAKDFVKENFSDFSTAEAKKMIHDVVSATFRIQKADEAFLIEAYNESQREKVKKEYESTPWYVPSASGKGVEFAPSILAEHISNTENLFYYHSTFYIYENGVYAENDDLEVQQIIRSKMIPRLTKSSQIEDVLKQLKMTTYKREGEIEVDENLINLKNGIFDIKNNKLIEHTPELLMTMQFPVEYKESATCPSFEKFLTEVLTTDQIPLVKQIMGYLLVRNQKAQKAFILHGVAHSGKSTLLRVIQDVLIGRKNVSNISWQDLSTRFRPAELDNKAANIFADLSDKVLDDVANFKSLTGEDRVTVERKSKNPFSMFNFAKLLFSCNELPTSVSDHSEGLFRRLIIIPFTKAIKIEDADPNLVEKLSSEASGILNFALEGLKELIDRNYIFSETSTNKAQLDGYREQNNNVILFINECCLLGDKFAESSKELYLNYVEYCKATGLKSCSDRKFKPEILKNFPSLKEGRDKVSGRRAIVGLRFLPVEERD